MFAVALVVPLLSTYYKSAGITAGSLELMSTLFSGSQIMGGMAIGIANDAGILSKRSTLVLSFAGSMLSYCMIGFSRSFVIICLSRILVGFVKQTMTVITAMISAGTGNDERVSVMGRFSTCVQVSWFIGPSAGSFLYKRVGERAPCVVAGGIFALNVAVVLLCLPSTRGNNGSKKVDKEKKTPIKEIVRSNSALLPPLLTLLLYSFVARSTSSSTLINYWETRYQVESYVRGYIMSYSSLLGLVIQWALIKPFFSRLTLRTGSVVAFWIYVSGVAVENLCQGNIWFYLGVVVPLSTISFSVLQVSLKTLITTTCQKEYVSSVLAALDVMTSCLSVMSPFYRSLIFRKIGYIDSLDEDMLFKWSWLVFGHWVAVAAISSLLLLGGKKLENNSEKKKE